MALRKKKNVWYVYFRDVDGRQINRSLKTHEKPMAIQLHAEYMSRMRAAKGARVMARDFAQWMPVIIYRRFRKMQLPDKAGQAG